MISEDRQKILNKIAEYEKNQWWDKDVEDDPETIVLMPDKVDYLYEKPFAKMWNRIANKKAVKFFDNTLKKGEWILKEVRGIENFIAVKGGAIITCNHFNAFDNYAIYKAIKDHLRKGQNLYKVIREGNYTNFKGIFGFFFRHCNTLPLSSNFETMKKFYSAISTLLYRGEKILIYPEQGMWWNYRKPRPMKNGAFRFAVTNNVPIIPAFITLEDTENLDNNGYPVQAYTVHFLPAIYPKENTSVKENSEYLMKTNYDVWKEVYEEFYKIPLKYGE